MPRSNKAIIHYLNTNPKCLRLQIKGYEASVKSAQWSLDYAIKNPAPPSQSSDHHYCDRLREDIERYNGWIAELKEKLNIATAAV